MILYFDRVQGHDSYASCIDQKYSQEYHATQLFSTESHEFKSERKLFVNIITKKGANSLQILLRTSSSRYNA
jgi:hypothetical protein